MTFADFLAHRNRIYSRISPGKYILFPSIAAESTPIRLLAKDFVLLCTLIHVIEPLIPFLFVSTEVCSLAFFTATLTGNQLATY